MENTFELFNQGKITYVPNFISKKLSTQLISHLKEAVPWTHGVYKMYGKEILTPRLLYAMKDKDTDITDSYSVTDSMVWTNELSKLKKKVEKITNKKFTYAQINYYRTGDDYIGFHSDSEVKDGDVIVSISLGADRKFTFKNKNDPSLKHSMILEDGSLLIMDDKAAKHNWKHSLPKMKNVGERINITFRPS